LSALAASTGREDMKKRLSAVATLPISRKAASGKTYYNHQTWTGGRNVVRYVPPDKVEPLRQAIAGYRKFLKLADEYAESVSKRTRI
jgi:hypothetical protein